MTSRNCVFSALTTLALRVICVLGTVTLDSPDVLKVKIREEPINLDCAFRITTPNEKVTQLTWSRKYKYENDYKVILQVPIPLGNGQRPFYRDYDLKRRTNITIGEMLNWRTPVRVQIQPICPDEAMYRCQVNVFGGIQPSPVDTSVQIQEKPKVISLEQNRAVPENQQTVFKCSAAVGKPEARVSWVMESREGKYLKNTTMGGTLTKRMDSEFCSPLAESTLIKHVTADDERIRCVVSRGREVVFLEKPVLVQYSTRNTKIHSEVNGNKVADWVTSISAEEGDLVVMNCTSRGRPTPHYNWRYSPKRGSDSGAWFDSENTSAIFLSNVTNNQSGTYQCVSANMVSGNPHSHHTEIYLVINSPPQAPVTTPAPGTPLDDRQKITAAVASVAVMVGLVVLTVCAKCCR